MSTGEIAYLALVIGGMLAFALTLAWATYVQKPANPPKAAATDATWSQQKSGLRPT
jgi:hypothetical protein